MILWFKKEFPEIKGTSNALEYASAHGHIDTLLLLIKKFPEIECTPTVFRYAFVNNHPDVLMVLRKEFPDFVPDFVCVMQV